MASGRDIKAGRAFVEVFLKDKLTGGLKALQRRAMAVGASLTKIGGALFAAGAGVAAAFVPAIKAASDMQEGLNKFGAVFGKETDAASAFVEDLADRVGRSAIDVRDSMSSFQAMFVGLNFDPGQAREMSQSMQALALDFGSFFNISDEEASSRFLSGLSGSSEVFDKFGINTKAAAIDQKLLEMGLNKTTATATEQEKVMARVAIIQASLAKQGATGDAEKTAGGFANQMKRLKGEVKDAAAAIGTALLPVVTPLITQAAAFTKIAGEWIAQNGELVATVFKVAVGIALAGGALLAAGTAAIGFSAILGGLSTAATLLAGVLGAVFSPLGLILAGIVAIGYTLLTQTEAGGEALDWLRGKFGELKTDAIAAFDGIKNALAAGDLKLAGQILWAALKVQWTAGTGFLKDKWADATAGLKSMWVDVSTFFGDIWAALMVSLKTGFNTFLRSSIAALMGFAAVAGAASGIGPQVAIGLGKVLASLDAPDAGGLDQHVAASDAERRKRLVQIEDERRRDRGGNADDLAARRRELDELLERAKAQAAAIPESPAKQPEARIEAGRQAAVAAFDSRANTGSSLNSAAGINAVAAALRGSSQSRAETEAQKHRRKLEEQGARRIALLQDLVKQATSRPPIVEAPIG